MTGKGEVRFDLGGMLEKVQAELREHGIHVDVAGDASACSEAGGGAKVKVICVAPGLRNSMAEMSKTPRDQVVMVRVDEKTSAALDAWMETGTFKSRSEAAALFIREGLKVRSSELDQLRDALRDVDAAKARLHRKAREVFGDEPSESG